MKEITPPRKDETDKKRGTRRFQERVAQEREAEREIRNYEVNSDYREPKEEDTIDNDTRPTFP